MSVTQLASLANVRVSETQDKQLKASISSIITFMDEIKILEVESVSETSRVTEEENVFRDDVIEQSLTQEEALKNAKKTYNGFFVVPYVFSAVK